MCFRQNEVDVKFRTFLPQLFSSEIRHISYTLCVFISVWVVIFASLLQCPVLCASLSCDTTAFPKHVWLFSFALCRRCDLRESCHY